MSPMVPPEKAMTKFHAVPVGKARVARSDDDVTAIAYGLIFHEALKAAEELAEEGTSIEVTDLRSLQPLGKETILKLVEKTGKAVRLKYLLHPGLRCEERR